jgi:ankyrin repeat protein
MLDDLEVHSTDYVISLVLCGECSQLRQVLQNEPSFLTEAKDWAGDALLSISIVQNRADMAMLLIDEFSADVNARNHEGMTPLHRACQQQNIDLVRLLCDRGSDLLAADDSGKRPSDLGGPAVRRFIEVCARCGTHGDVGSTLICSSFPILLIFTPST